MSELKLDVHALVDGEALDSDRSQIMAAMAEQPELRAEYEWAVYIKHTLNEKCKSQGGQECWKAAIVQMDAIDRTKRTENFVGKYAWAFCGVFVAAIAIASVSNQLTGRTSLSTSTGAGFYAGMTPIQSAVNADEALEAIKARLGSAPAMLSATPVILVDQILYGEVNGHKSMVVRFRDRSGPLELTLLQGISGVDTISEPVGDGLNQGSINGVNAVSWTEGDCLMVLVSPRSHSDLAAHARGIGQVR